MQQTAQKVLGAAGIALLALPRLGAALPTNCSLPFVKDALLRDAVTAEALLKRAQDLEDIAYSTPGRNRVAGSLGHDLTVQYLSDELAALGDYYDVEIQPWTGQVQSSGEALFVVNGKEYESQVIEFSPSGDITGVPLVPVANLGCEAADVPATVAGAIALIHRGTCNFSVKSALAKAAGAVGVVFWNNDAGLVQGTYGGVLDDVVPATGISTADGEALVALAGNSTVLASLNVVTVIEEVQSSNVIATSKYGDPDNILFLGAHSDSVSEGPGINDDGSGSVGILEVATQLSKFRTKAQVKFGWWTAEEAGLLGSTYYVSTLSEEELQKIRLYLNFDMIASPNYILGHYDGDGSEFGEVGPAGSAEVEHFFEEYYESLGLNHTATEFNGRSDYGPFLENGVPCGGLDAGADEVKTQEWVDMFGGTAGIILDPNYHQAGDNVANLNMFAFEVMAKGIASAVANYAGSGFAGFPPRETVVERRSETAVTKDNRHLEEVYEEHEELAVFNEKRSAEAEPPRTKDNRALEEVYEEHEEFAAFNEKRSAEAEPEASGAKDNRPLVEVYEEHEELAAFNQKRSEAATGTKDNRRLEEVYEEHEELAVFNVEESQEVEVEKRSEAASGTKDNRRLEEVYEEHEELAVFNEEAEVERRSEEAGTKDNRDLEEIYEEHEEFATFSERSSVEKRAEDAATKDNRHLEQVYEENEELAVFNERQSSAEKRAETAATKDNRRLEQVYEEHEELAVFNERRSAIEERAEASSTKDNRALEQVYEEHEELAVFNEKRSSVEARSDTRHLERLYKYRFPSLS